MRYALSTAHFRFLFLFDGGTGVLAVDIRQGIDANAVKPDLKMEMIAVTTIQAMDHQITKVISKALSTLFLILRI